MDMVIFTPNNLRSKCRPCFYVIPVATCLSRASEGEAHKCVFHGREMCGVATNVYLRKTLEKSKVGL